MKVKLCLIFCLAFTRLFSQQWVDKKYAYDSLLNVTYGASVNFNNQVDSLQMDIYLPVCSDPAQQSKRPLLVWIHGGAFLAGNKNDQSIQRLCKQFARRGYVTASISYRLGFIADDNQWDCNYPNYKCVFANESAEWVRAWYRGVQDGKGAIRYLINRHEQFRIDPDNVFVAGESAGGFVALGAALLDDASERLPQTFQLADLPKPHPSMLDCLYNQGETFSTTISRPDLGGIDGTIEPTVMDYTIRGVGNMYGGMLNDLLKTQNPAKPKPVIYSFHQPCDLVVPIDSGVVYQWLSWCFTNGYSCYGIANTPKVYGSRGFSLWNTLNNYGYTIQNEFTSVNFPFSFLFGDGSCADQVNKPCHAYDNAQLRENNLAKFFSGYVTTSPVCLPGTTGIGPAITDAQVTVFPNPVSGRLTIACPGELSGNIALYDVYGKQLKTWSGVQLNQYQLDLSAMPAGCYQLVIGLSGGQFIVKKIVNL